MAQHLIGLNLTCQIVCSALNALMIYPNLIRAAMVYPKALYSDLCFSHCTPLLSVLLFPHSHSVTILMLMTPSCSYPSKPTKFNENISCLQTALSAIAYWMTSNLLCFNSAKTIYLLLGLKPQLNKIYNPALPSVMVLQSVPHPQLAILVSSLMPISPSPIRFLHLLARASITSGISDAYALSLTSVQPTSLAHHSCIQSSITATRCTMVFQKPS